MAGPTPAELFESTPNRTVAVPGGQVVFRALGGQDAGTPLVALTHLAANLDSWDPDLVDPLAAGRQVLLLGYRGVGHSTGRVRDSIDDMADDAVAAIRALGLRRVDLFGLSMGGMVAQEVADRAPELVDHLILASSGPAGGPGLTRMTGVMVRSILRGITTRTDPTALLFFTRTATGKQAASTYRTRLRRRRTGRDRAIGIGVLRAQLRAVHRWGTSRPRPEPTFTGPVLVLHGDSDRMVPVANVATLLERHPRAAVQVFADAGHGVVSQDRAAVVDAVRGFLAEEYASSPPRPSPPDPRSNRPCAPSPSTSTSSPSARPTSPNRSSAITTSSWPSRPPA